MHNRNYIQSKCRAGTCVCSPGVVSKIYSQYNFGVLGLTHQERGNKTNALQNRSDVAFMYYSRKEKEIER